VSDGIGNGAEEGVGGRAAVDEEGNGEGSKSDGDAYKESDGGGNEGDGRRRG